MAHNLMNAGSFAATQSAWHRLGNINADFTSVNDALNHPDTDLDWSVNKHPLRADLPDGSSVDFDMFGLMRGPTKNDPTYKRLGVCGKDYDYWQNRDVAELVDDLAFKTGWGFETCGALGDGATFFVTLRVKEWDVKGDPIDRFFSYIERRDGKNAAHGLISDIRIVCQNTLDAAMRGAKGKIAIKHNSNYKLESSWAVELVSAAQREGKNIEAAMNALAELRVNDEMFSGMLDVVAPMPHMPNLLTMPNLAGRDKVRAENAERVYNAQVRSADRTRNQMITTWQNKADIPVNLRNTGWDAYQAVTHHTTHTYGNTEGRGRKATDITRAHNDLFGSGVTMRSNALQFLVSGAELFD